jgi:hypothetical protein
MTGNGEAIGNDTGSEVIASRNGSYCFWDYLHRKQGICLGCLDKRLPYQGRRRTPVLGSSQNDLVFSSVLNSSAEG